MKPRPLVRRLDVELVERSLAESREQAQRLILAGEVWVEGQRWDKASKLCAASAAIEVRGGDRYVSRGGHKLEGALTGFHLDVTGWRCLDLGASTGGFTDCLLQRGATHVTGGLHTWLSMEVSSPAATYNPNSGGGAGSVQVYDYSATIPIDAGATIRLKAFDIDCLMHRYCQNMDNTNCKGLVQPPISPADAPIDGSFLVMTVTAVVAQ